MSLPTKTRLLIVFLGSAFLADAKLVTSVAEFSEQELKKLDWRIVDDRVMGGRSQGRMAITQDGVLKFSGMLSLENNGGFSSVRSGDIKLDLSEAEGLVLRVKGDGRRYEVHLTTPARPGGRGITFAGFLPTTEGNWTEVKIPFSEFQADFRGKRVVGVSFDPSEIRGVTLELVDKKAGAFEIQVDWIRTYGERQEGS